MCSSDLIVTDVMGSGLTASDRVAIKFHDNVVTIGTISGLGSQAGTHNICYNISGNLCQIHGIISHSNTSLYTCDDRTHRNDEGRDLTLGLDARHFLLDGYPIRGSRRKGKVFVQFPRATFYVRKGNVNFTPIQQAQCRYYQEEIGRQFAHPHVYNDGHTCWDNSKRERATDFIANIVETLSLQNVTKDSVTIGLCASGIMGVKMEALKNAQQQQKAVNTALKPKAIISDRRKLESYVSKRWCSKITILTRAA